MKKEARAVTEKRRAKRIKSVIQAMKSRKKTLLFLKMILEITLCSTRFLKGSLLA